MLSGFSHVRLCVTRCTASHQASLARESMGFSRQEYWSGLPCAPPGNLSDSGIETVSLMSNLQWLAGFLPLATGKPIRVCACVYTFIYVCIYISPFGFLSHLGHYRALSRVLWSFPGGFSGKESAWECRKRGFDPGLGRFPGVGNSNPLQCSFLDNSMDRRARWAAVHGVEKSWTWLSSWAHHWARQ